MAARRGALVFAVGIVLGAGVSACGGAGRARGMDEVGRSMAALGETLRARAETLRESASRAERPSAREALISASEQWRTAGDALSAEGARVIRAAGIVGQTTGGSRRPDNASRVYISGVEGEAEGLVSDAGRVDAWARTLRAIVPALRAVEAVDAAAAEVLLADATSLSALAADSRRSGEAMLEQVRRYRQSLGERTS